MDSDLHGKSLVKVHMTDITTTGSRVGQTYLSVEISSVQVYLTSVVVNDLAGLLRCQSCFYYLPRYYTHTLDSRLKHTEC